jgi:hypothetical protein
VRTACEETIGRKQRFAYAFRLSVNCIHDLLASMSLASAAPAFEVEAICRTAIASIIGRDPKTMQVTRTAGDVLFLTYVRPMDNFVWTYKRRGSPSQGWRPFLRNHAPNIAAMDLFVVPTIGFKLVYGFVIVRLHRRDLVWINVTTHPTAEWVAHQITEAFPWDGARAI